MYSKSFAHACGIPKNDGYMHTKFNTIHVQILADVLPCTARLVGKCNTCEEDEPEMRYSIYMCRLMYVCIHYTFTGITLFTGM